MLPRGVGEFRETGLITAERMRAVDANAHALGLGPLPLMESAGAALAGVVRAYRPARVLALCGRGNNGGDGMVAARYLQDLEVMVMHVEDGALSPECAAQKSLLMHCRVEIHPVRCRDDVLSSRDLFEKADVIIDALLGTGIRGTLREPQNTMVEMANSSPARIVSADMPTPGIRADRICAFHRAKVEGSEVAEIGIPLEAEVSIGPGDLLQLKRKDRSARKGDGGRVLVIGGGPYQGAPYLCGLGALRAGADIVRIASPVFEPVPDLIFERLEGNSIGAEHIEQLLRAIDRSDVVIMGNGLGDKSHHVIRALAPHCKKAVFDADAIRQPLPECQMAIFTPHTGEFERMTGKNPGPDPIARGRAVRDAAKGSTVLLKGPQDVISDGQRVRFNLTGTPLMTVGGTGDVLAGIAGALFCLNPAFESACIAAYINGMAGQMVEKRQGGGMLASDLPDQIPFALFGGGVIND